MENFISTNMYNRNIEVTCVSGSGTYSGNAEKIIDGVLVLTKLDKKIYVSIDKIVSFKELE